LKKFSGGYIPGAPLKREGKEVGRERKGRKRREGEGRELREGN
jgi:hypothetical protein